MRRYGKLAIDRKVPPRSRLKTMTAASQEDLALYLSNHTLAEASEYLQQHYKTGRVGTSAACISRWFAWYRRVQRFETNSATIEALIELDKRKDPSLTEQALFERGQRMFSAMAIDQEDADAWQKIQILRLKAAESKRDERKLVILEKRAAQAEAAEAAVRDVNLTPEQKQERIRQIFGLTE